MLEIKNWEVWGLERSLLASGNAMTVGEINTRPVDEDLGPQVEVLERGERLGGTKVGSAHDHFLLGIHVQFDIRYPQYWSLEAERYHNFEIITSQSKMHRLTSAGSKEEFASMFNKYVDIKVIEQVKIYCDNFSNKATMTNPVDFSIMPQQETQHYWFMKALSNLPMGYELWMTCDLTYLQLKTIYFQRRNHKLQEWHTFCDWCETLPYFKQLIGIGV